MFQACIALERYYFSLFSKFYDFYFTTIYKFKYDSITLNVSTLYSKVIK